MKLYNGVRVRVKVKKWFTEKEEIGVVISNVFLPLTIGDKETDMPIKSEYFLVWTFNDGKIRHYHRMDIDTNTTKLRVFDA